MFNDLNKEYLVRCANCSSRETKKVYEDKITFKCNCGITIYYKPTETRPYYLKRFVSRDEYLENKRLKENERRKTGIPDFNY